MPSDAERRQELISKLRSDLLYESIRSVPPILAIIAGYVIPIAYRLIEVPYSRFRGDDAASVHPAVSIDKDVAVLVRQPVIDRPTTAFDLEYFPTAVDVVADPVLPLYYFYDRRSRRISSIDRGTMQTAAWSDRKFGGDDDRIAAIGCPATGIVSVLAWHNKSLYFNLLTKTDSKSSKINNQPRSVCFGATAGSYYVITGRGPIRITVGASTAIMSPTVSAPPADDGSLFFDLRILLLLSNGLLLTQLWTGGHAGLVAVDPDGFDRRQAIEPVAPQTFLQADSVACSRTTSDLVYMTLSNRLFEFYLPSDLFFDLRYSGK